MSVYRGPAYPRPNCYNQVAAVVGLEHVLAVNPQRTSNLISQPGIATLGAGNRIKRTLEELLQDEDTGLWYIPTAAQREKLKRQWIRP